MAVRLRKTVRHICESVFGIDINVIPIMFSFKRIKRQQYFILCWLQLFAFVSLDQYVYSDMVSIPLNYVLLD